MGETHLRQRRQTVKLGLIKVVQDLFPAERLKTAYSIQDGVFCKLADSALSKREVQLIDQHLRQWVADNAPIEFLYKKDGYFQYRLGDEIVRTIYPAGTSAAMVEPFRIVPFSEGFIVDFGEFVAGYKPLILPEKLASTYDKAQRWLDNINLAVVDDVNAYITSGKAMNLLGMAEALQEKEIADIADMILQQQRAIRVVLISGPSSSGKTTFTQRLATQLFVNGLRPVSLSLDNYFVDREATPKDTSGGYDFEALEAIDLPLLQQHLAQLIGGETIASPLYDFTIGRRSGQTKTMHLSEKEILLIEGIHALNPNLAPGIGRNLLFKIYISALFELNVDLTNRIPTTEVRLLRRMVRGDRFRGTLPAATLDQWANVRRGENRYIFSYREEADVMFNSSLLYEMNVLRPFAEATLQKIPMHDKGAHYDTRERLMNLLAFFQPLEAEKVPFNSILREFIGGSIYSL